MSLKPRDPLLTVARAVLGIFIILLSVAAVALMVAAPAVLIMRNTVLAELASRGSTAGMQLVWAIAGTMLVAAVLVVLAILFLVLLRRMVISVGEGDPFIPANARRLEQMAWIAISGQVLSIPVNSLLAWIADLTRDMKDVHIVGQPGISANGILLIIVLFILARVFRKGTEMREELEGTV